ncbi:MAG TPA: GGDEF domain-containing protein [Thermoanaerobaculia bacterium]|nr:GGDEF domain-containing protein [Thermoanaerobaculia bacterium]
MSRASTLLLALLVLNTLLGVLCLAVSRGQRDPRALRLWGWGLLMYSAGLLITIPEAIPFALRKIVGNALIAYAPILTIGGSLSHTPFRLRRRWTTLAFAASVLPIVVNHLGNHYEVLVDILAPAPIANILFILGAVVLLRDPPPDARGAARLVAASFLISVLVWSLRVFAVWSSIGGTNDRDRADLTIALFSIAQMVTAVASTLGLLWIEVRMMEAELRRLANQDPLTGLPNRRATVERFQQETSRAARHRRDFGLLLFDVDRFKAVNDTHGHQVGDLALRQVSTVLGTEKREVDAVGRIGGEEFVVLLVEEELAGALVAANRLRERIAAATLKHQSLELSVSVSGGLAMYPADGTDWDHLFAVADRRLYAAKSGGRNRVVGPPGDPPGALSGNPR